MVASWATVQVESFESVGWSDLAVVQLVTLSLGDAEAPLEHRRGRYLRPGG